ncbi:MAG: ribosome silencing factor [Alphaproteobacteria bacterium]|nr:ribosome silencing factor [Alphaproteobacteria bacterium]
MKKPARKPAAKPRNAAPKKPAPKKLAAPSRQRTASPAGVPEQLRDLALRALDGRKAENVMTVDLRGRSAIADYLIIATGRSSRQIAALADGVREVVMKSGSPPPRIEGKQQGDWVLVDAGDVIVHLFRPEVRHFYNIETIYGLAPPRD